MNTTPEDPTDEIHDLLAGYALGTLDPEEERFIEHNLPYRPRWQVELDRYREVVTALSHAPETQEVPLRVRAGVLTTVALGDNAPDHVSEPGPASTPFWRRGFARVALVAALPVTILAIILVAYTVVMHNQYQSQESELAQYQQVQGEAAQVLVSNETMPTVIDMQQTSAAPLARGRVFLDRAGRQAVIVVRDLPPLQDAEVYMVWLGGNDTGNPLVKVGSLQMSRQGTGQITIGPIHDLSSPNTVTVTVEPTTESTSPQGPLVLSASF